MQTPTKTAQQPLEVSVGPSGVQITNTTNLSATAAWRAAVATRNELKQQLETAIEQRHGYLRELEDHGDVGGQAVTGMHQRIGQLDARIAELDIALTAANTQVAQTASVPGAVTEVPRLPRRERDDGPPFEMLTLIPITIVAIAFAKWLLRRKPPRSEQLPSDLSERLSRLEQMGEATAIEIERIGEGQRFVTRILTERGEKALSEGTMLNEIR